MTSPAEAWSAAERARRLRLRAHEWHVRALLQAKQARIAREDAARDRLALQLWQRDLEADDRERRRAVGRWMDLIASDAAGADRRGLAFFDADFCIAGDRPAMMTALLAAALRFGRASMGNVQLLDAESGGLRIAAQQGFGPEFMSHFALVDDDRSACGLAMLHARAVHVHDVAHSPVFGDEAGRTAMLEAGARAVRSIPMVGPDGAVMGVLSVHYSRPHDPAEAEQRILTTLAEAAVRRLTRPPLPG
jgi:GAF domain-containing protein